MSTPKPPRTPRKKPAAKKAPKKTAAKKTPKKAATKPAATKPRARKSTKPGRSAAAPEPAAAPDPTTDEALLALPIRYAAPPDIPVDVARREIASLARMGKVLEADLARVGITIDTLEEAARFARVLGRKQKAWERARKVVALTVTERKWLIEAEALDAKLVAGGRWALRHDPSALAELARIAEGSGLTDTLRDLRDLRDFWAEHREHLHRTLITQADLDRIPVLVQQLQPAARKEADDIAATRAQGLRNRAFWAAHELAQDIREGSRYALAHDPKLAAKFISRYRSAVAQRVRKKAKRTPAAPPAAELVPA